MPNNIDPNKVQWDDIGTENLVAQNFPSEAAPTMLKVIPAESGGNPMAVNINKNGTKDRGLAQINDIHIPELKQAGIISSPQDLYVPETNIKAAAYLHGKSGFKPWSSSQAKWDTNAIDPNKVKWDSTLPSPDEQVAMTHTGKQVTDFRPPTWQQNVSTVARPILQAGGMVGGGLAGAWGGGATGGVTLPVIGAIPGAIAGSVAGAGLGYAGGEQAANKLDELLGLRQPKPLGQELLQAGKDIRTGATMEMGGQVAGPLIGTGLKKISRIFTEPLGVATGTGGNAIVEAYKNNPGFRQGINGEVNEEALVGNMYDKLVALAEKRGNAYAEAVQGLKTNTPVDTTTIEKTLVQRLKDFGTKITRQIPDEFKGLGDKIPPDLLAEFPEVLTTRGARGGGAVKSAAEEAYAALKNFKAEGDFSPYGVDTLRMQLRDIAESSPQAKAMLRPVIDNIKSTVESVAPGYRQMLKNYETASNQINELQKALTIRGEGVSKDTTIRKLDTIFRDVNKYRLAKLDELDPGGELRAQVAGIALRAGMPRGQLSRLLHLGTVGGVGMVTHSPLLAAGLMAVSSPRLVGETANLMGKTAGLIPPGLGEATARTLMMPQGSRFKVTEIP